MYFFLAVSKKKRFGITTNWPPVPWPQRGFVSWKLPEGLLAKLWKCCSVIDLVQPTRLCGTGGRLDDMGSQKTPILEPPLAVSGWNQGQVIDAPNLSERIRELSAKNRGHILFPPLIVSPPFVFIFSICFHYKQSTWSDGLRNRSVDMRDACYSI